MLENNRLKKTWQSGQKYREGVVLNDLILGEQKATTQQR